MPRSEAAATSTQSQPVAVTEISRQSSNPGEHSAVERHVVGQDGVGATAGCDERIAVAAEGEGLDARVRGQVAALDREVAALCLRHLGDDNLHCLRTTVRPISSTAETKSPGQSGSQAKMPPAPAFAATYQAMTVASDRLLLQNAALAGTRSQ